MVGNALEWYEFILYAQFTTIISQKFFPSNRFSLVLTLAVFATGFLARPLGGIFFGNMGDKSGRRSSLTLGILLMVLPTTAIGLLPEYEYIGAISTVGLIFCRLLQGFSLGGEFSGCVAYLVEQSPPLKRGIVGTTVYISQCLGMLLGLLVVWLLGKALSDTDLSCWGWRLPFILGLIIGIISLCIRRNLSKTPLYLEAKAKGYLSPTPLKDLIKKHRSPLFLAIGLYINATSQFYAATIFIPTYLETIGFKMLSSSTTASINLLTMIIIYPFAAFLSDKIGRKPVIIGALIILLGGLYPLFYTMSLLNPVWIVFSQTLFSATVATYMAPMPAILAELFPTPVRFSGISLSCNLSAAIFGGTIPMVGTLIYQLTDNKLSVVYYLILLACVGLFIAFSYKETFRKNMRLKEFSEAKKNIKY